MLLFLMAIAQMNWGRLKHPIQHKKMREFKDSLDNIYSLAENHRGFLWRISDNQAELQLADLGFDKLISATVSVWESIELLKEYTYESLHGFYLKKSSEWFETLDEPRLVIWDVNINAQPTFSESFRRLNYLKIHGSSDYAYGWHRT